MPAAGSPMRAKHMEQIVNYFKTRYNQDLVPSGGKINPKTGERRDEAPEVGVDKPDWRSGQWEAQSNPDAQVHEGAHLEIMPEGTDLPGGQTLMDKQYADVQRDYGYMKQKQSQHEVQPMAVENKLRRRMGLPANRSGNKVSVDAPPRMALEGGPAAVRVATGEGKAVDLLRQARLLSESNKKRIDQVDRGELKWHPTHGWHMADSPDAIINQRARVKAEDPAYQGKDKGTLMRSELEKAAVGPSISTKPVIRNRVTTTSPKYIQEPQVFDGRSIEYKGTVDKSRNKIKTSDEEVGMKKSDPSTKLPGVLLDKNQEQERLAKFKEILSKCSSMKKAQPAPAPAPAAPSKPAMPAMPKMQAPKLPKPAGPAPLKMNELEKAKVDEGKSPEDKASARSERNDRTSSKEVGPGGGKLRVNRTKWERANAISSGSPGKHGEKVKGEEKEQPEHTSGVHVRGATYATKAHNKVGGGPKSGAALSEKGGGKSWRTGGAYHSYGGAEAAHKDVMEAQSKIKPKLTKDESEKNKNAKQQKGVHAPAFAHNYESGTSDVGARMAPGGASKDTNEWAKEQHKNKLAELKAMPKPKLTKSWNEVMPELKKALRLKPEHDKNAHLYEPDLGTSKMGA